MKAAQCKAEIIKILRDLAPRHDLWRAFSDSMEMLALALSNKVDPVCYAEREARYLDIAKTYTKDELTQISHILPLLTLAFEETFTDYLGQIFMELDLGNAHKGQFFTPYSISKLMAQITLDGDIQEIIKTKGHFTLSEPSVGSGGMVIAACDALRDQGINYQQACHATCIDVDIKAVHMAYIQLSIIGLPAVVTHGNTLLMTEQSRWGTPFHFLGGWGRKLDATPVIEADQVTHEPQLELF
jgi:hypothetical protein